MFIIFWVGELVLENMGCKVDHPESPVFSSKEVLFSPHIWSMASKRGRYCITSHCVMNHDTCVTCHTCHTSVTDFRPKSGNPVEVTLVTSPKLYIVSHTKVTTSLSFNINLDTTSLSFLCLRQTL